MSARQAAPLAAEVDDGIVVYLPLRSRFLDLNETASECWTLIVDERCPTSSAIRRLMARHSIDEDTAAEALAAFLSAMEAEGTAMPG